MESFDILRVRLLVYFISLTILLVISEAALTGNKSRCTEILTGQDSVVRRSEPSPISVQSLLASGPSALNSSKLYFRIQVASNAKELVDGLASIQIFYEGTLIGVSSLRRWTLSEQWAFQNININQNFQRMRLGTIAYLLLGKAIYDKTGFDLRSDPFLINGAALKTWESLVRLGYAVRIGSNAYVFNHSPQALSEISAMMLQLQVETKMISVFKPPVDDAW